jgi:hypothetical protein
MNRRLLIASALFLLYLCTVNGQTDQNNTRKKPLVIERITAKVNFDGVPDEDFWSDSEPLPMVMHSPVYGKEPTEKSEIRILYDDKYLYAGAWLRYNDPAMMQSVSYKRDYMGMGSDWLGLFLDTYNDKENALMFFTTPDGLRFDAGIQKDAVPPRPDQEPMNLSWNAFWDVMTKKDSNGWSAEIRIPLSSLRFQEVNGEVKMGLTVERWIPSKNETDVFPPIPPNWGETSVMKPSQAQEIVFHDITPDKPLYIAPYALTGFESSFGLNNEETEYLKSNDPDLEAGLDIKYGITKTLVMDVTVNTDFAQVEADDQQINLTRFSLYFPEKRMFFLERASVFDFSLGGNSNLFYSRRIGLLDEYDDTDDEEEPEPVRIYGGARVTGRMKKWDVGFLDMQTAPLVKKVPGGSSLKMVPSENFGVVRFRRQILNENTYIGAMTTSRLGADGSYNLAYGLDGIFKVFGNDYFEFRWTQTFEDEVENESIKDPTLLMATWERRSRKGLAYNFGYTQSGTHFNPGIGFEMMDDYTILRGGFSYGWISPEKSKIYSHGPETRVMYRTYIDDGTFMNLTNFTGWKFQTKSQWIGSAELVYNGDRLRDSLEISRDKLYITPGEYDALSFRGNLSTPMSNPFYLDFMTEAGQFYDGSRLSLRFMPTWNISRHFELGGTYNFDHVSVKKRNLSMTNHILGIKALYMFDTKLSINAFIQYNTDYDGIITNFRIRYNPKEGNDLYLVFNEDRNTDLYREMPVLPVYNSRAVMLKYTYTFNL